MNLFSFFIFVSLLGAKATSIETNGKDLKIIAFTDIHFGDPIEFLINGNNIITQHNPDFVILCGDNLNDPEGQPSLDVPSLMFTANKIKWTALMGNHDRDAGLSEENNRLEGYDDYCLYTPGTLEPVNFEKYGNHAIDITSQGNIIYKLVFLDSGPFYSVDSDSNGYIEEYQVQWYEDLMTQAAKDAGHVVPSMVFMHIPLIEEIDAVKMALGDTMLGDIPPEYGWGEIGQIPTGNVQGINTGLFDVVKKVGGTHILFGHIHDNNADIIYQGIEMVHITKTGQHSTDLPFKRTAFATEILFEVDPQTGVYTPQLYFAMPDGTVTRDPHAWQKGE